MTTELINKVYTEFMADVAELGAKTDGELKAKIDSMQQQIDNSVSEMMALKSQLLSRVNIKHEANKFLEDLDRAFSGNAPEHMLWMNLRTRFGFAPAAKLERRERQPKPPIPEEARDKVMRVLTHEPMSATQVAQALSIETPEISPVLIELVKSGKVRTEGTKRAKRYMLAQVAEA